MTKKFNIGDKVIPLTKTTWSGLEDSQCWKRAKEKSQGFLYVNSYESDGTLTCGDNKGSSGDFFKESDLVLYTEEIAKTKNAEEIISKLETLVGEANVAIKGLKEAKETKAKEDAQLKIIEEAKKFVQKYQAVRFGQSSHLYVDYATRGHYYETEFATDEVKGKTTAIVYLLKGGKTRQAKPKVVGRATCNKDDVFNKHVGEAIALGRALEINVDKFINASIGK